MRPELERMALDLRRQLPLLIEISGPSKPIEQRLYLRIARPAKPSLFAGSAEHAETGRIEDVDRQGPGNERVPTTRSWRLLSGAPRDDGLPVHRLQHDGEAATLELLFRDVTGVVEHWDIGGMQENDGHAIVARLG
jgi:hypothetical protein